MLHAVAWRRGLPTALHDVVDPAEVGLLVADDAAFMAANRLSLRNTFVANFMDGCSISSPMNHAGELPTGLLLSSVHGHDARLLDVAQAVEALLKG